MEIIVNIVLLVLLLVLTLLETEFKIRLRTRSLKGSGIIVYNAIKYTKALDIICVILFNV